MDRARIHDLIDTERLRQDKKWGTHQDHNLPEWGTILGEEYGEACTEINRVHFGFKDTENLIAELVQVAAVCTAILEGLDEL